MRINNWSILYSLGYVIVNAGINTFYKRHQVVGIENIPKNKPVIFAANHQNAFLDPVVIAVKLSQPTYYLVRADIFKKPIVAKIFDSINMMPVFRERDGVNTKNANDAVFNRCYDILAKNRPIIIFPEGNHGKFKTLRSLKKGFARIAAGAEEKHGKEIDVQIVPVGLNYSDHQNMGAELLINFGKPIDASEYLESMDDPRQINAVKYQLEEAMSSQIIDIQKADYYTFIHEMLFLFEEEIIAKYGKGDGSLEDKFRSQKKFIAATEQYISESPEESLEQRMISFKKQVYESGMRYWLFKKEKQPVFFDVVGLILFAPIHVYGVVNNYLPYKIPVWFVNKKIKDPQFHSSMKMAFGVVLFFVFWLAQALILGNQMPNDIQWLYAASLPVSAWISYQYWLKLLKTKGKLKYNQLKAKNEGRFASMAKTYKEFQSYFTKITK